MQSGTRERLNVSSALAVTDPTCRAPSRASLASSIRLLPGNADYRQCEQSTFELPRLRNTSSGGISVACTTQEGFAMSPRTSSSRNAALRRRAVRLGLFEERDADCRVG